MKSIADVTDCSIAELVSLRGRVAVVTGGGRGLGKAIVQRLCEAGASVLIGDIDKDLASKAAADLATPLWESRARHVHGCRADGVRDGGSGPGG